MKKIICLVGPSGSGKNYYQKLLEDNFNFKTLISHTTREPRDGEKNGETYYFTDLNTYNSLDKLQVSDYANNKYCLSRDEFDKQYNKYDNLLLITTYTGYLQILDYVKHNNLDIEVVYLFLEISENEAISRVLNRAADSEEKLKRISQIIDGENKAQGFPDFTFSQTFKIKEKNKYDYQKRSDKEFIDFIKKNF